MNTSVFTAGDGQKYGLVSREGSEAVVVFKYVDNKWWGRLEFNKYDSTYVHPGEALPEISIALDRHIL